MDLRRITHDLVLSPTPLCVALKLTTVTICFAQKTNHAHDPSGTTTTWVDADRSVLGVIGRVVTSRAVRHPGVGFLRQVPESSFQV